MKNINSFINEKYTSDMDKDYKKITNIIKNIESKEQIENTIDMLENFLKKYKTYYGMILFPNGNAINKYFEMKELLDKKSKLIKYKMSKMKMSK